ncbi:MAG TPA: DUF2203 family protein [Candidatus Poseidoniales archaeon]|nr:MAG TPA: DUF2203 family protein [Candidatus Poseidoniales archaeon]|tara:strand:+ start:462 stop:905 length:444 start_codon:yes stop_codon:yes gene_type:complete
MELDELSPEAALPYPLPDGALVVTIEQARASLSEAKNVLMVLQAMSDEAHDLTNELELLLDQYAMTHPHVMEVAEHLGSMVAQWQASVARLESIGARIVSMDPGRLEWYGVVDHRMALFSWAVGEPDIEWYYRMEEGFPSRKPLIEA